jgi:hypothetical protein
VPALATTSGPQERQRARLRLLCVSIGTRSRDGTRISTAGAELCLRAEVPVPGRSEVSQPGLLSCLVGVDGQLFNQS